MKKKWIRVGALLLTAVILMVSVGCHADKKNHSSHPNTSKKIRLSDKESSEQKESHKSDSKKVKNAARSGSKAGKKVNSSDAGASKKSRLSEKELSKLDVLQPKKSGQIIDAAQFGLNAASADNTAAMSAATVYLAANPGTKLNISKGVYHFSPESAIKIDNITEGVIEGNGSEFLFSTGNYFGISACDTLKIQNLTIDWDWEKGMRLASLVRVKSVKKNTVTLEFTEVSDASYAVTTPWETFNQFDAESLTPGCSGGKEFWDISPLVTNIKHLGGNLVSFSFSQAGSMSVGEVYLLRHFVYRSSVFRIGYSSQNITLQNIRIYSAYGMGVIAEGGAHHMLFSGMTIGLRPGTEKKYRISTTADAFHLADSGGYFIIEDCDVSFMGDDCLNTHNNMGILNSVNGKTITLSCFNGQVGYNEGTVLRFRNADDYSLCSVEATVESKVFADDTDVILVLDRDIGKKVPVGSVLYDAGRDSGNYVIRNNYFHENRARGLLLGASNGLVENNHFYKNQGAAIIFPVDLSDKWMEGSGVDNVIVRNNTFDHCDVGAWTSLIQFFTNNKGKPLSGQCFTNIEISNNTAIDFPGEFINIECAGGLKVTGNTIKNSTKLGYSRETRGMITARRFKELTVTDNTWVRSDFTAENVNEVNLTDEKPDPSQMTCKNNRIVL